MADPKLSQAAKRSRVVKAKVPRARSAAVVTAATSRITTKAAIGGGVAKFKAAAKDASKRA